MSRSHEGVNPQEQPGEPSATRIGTRLVSAVGDTEVTAITATVGEDIQNLHDALDSNLMPGDRVRFMIVRSHALFNGLQESSNPEVDARIGASERTRAEVLGSVALTQSMAPRHRRKRPIHRPGL